MSYTKEDVIKKTSIDELWCLFHTFKEYYNEDKDEKHKWIILDSEIEKIVKDMKRHYR